MKRWMSLARSAPTMLRRVLWVLPCLLLLGAVLTACATQPRVWLYHFTFDMHHDSPGVNVLDYEYRGVDHLISGRPKWSRDMATPYNREGIGGFLTKGTSLYVKWQIASSGLVYEDTVDLRGRLPTDITKHILTFTIVGAALRVFLISPERRQVADPVIGPPVYSFTRNYEIYPVLDARLIKQGVQ